MATARRTARLARAGVVENEACSAANRRRGTLRALLAICDRVRCGLADAGIDPGRAPALHHGDAWAAELAGLGHPPAAPFPDETPAGDAVAGFAAAAKFDAKILAMAETFRDRPAIDVSNSSLAELYAWCVSRQPRGEPASLPRCG